MHLQCTMSFNFDLKVRRLGMRYTLNHGTITVSGFGYFHKNFRFLWGKNVSKTNLGRTIHYTYTSYDKYFRLCMVSEELRLNEIGLWDEKHFLLDCPLYKHVRKKYKKLLDTNILSCTLNPHTCSPVSTKQTCLYQRLFWCSKYVFNNLIFCIILM